MNLTPDYVAGLFDGEGYINISKLNRKDCKSPSYQLHIRISIREESLLRQIQMEHGGSLRQYSKETAKHAAYFTWDVTGEQAKEFALRIGPLLKLKQKQAQLAVEFQTLKSLNKNQPNTQERVNALDAFYEALRAQNKKGPNSLRV